MSSDEITINHIPPSFTLRHTLRWHTDEINQIIWSPNGQMLASQSNDRTIVVWDADAEQQYQTLKGSSNESVSWSPDGQMVALGSIFNLSIWDIKTGVSRRMFKTAPGIHCVAWSPDGSLLASDFKDNTVRLWNVETGQLFQRLIGHSDIIRSLAWSPNGHLLASGANDHKILLWNAASGELHNILTGHSNLVTCVAWSPDGSLLASSSTDNTIRLWDPKIGQEKGILEGHTNAISNISFSFDGRLLASKSRDGTIRLWCLNTQETVAKLKEISSFGWNKETTSYRYGGKKWNASLAFHPNAPILATLGEADTVIRIWDLDFATLLGTAPPTPSFHYINAKVVLVGDSGVGKSGLGLVLAGQPFVPTESTHARRVWPFYSLEIQLDSGRKETREIMLWDLAGQPGYRLIHQLHLNEVAVALILFDARSETNPFAGVYHWDRALRQAQRVQGNTAFPLKKFLVAARIDRGGKSVSPKRIESLVRELSFDSYFETSAKEEKGITELAEAIKQSIDWTALPKVTSTDLFQQIKTFLVSEKEAGWLLSTAEDLYRTFLKFQNTPADTEELRAQFETCIGRVESRDLIRRLSFGNLVLLQPELLDAYASALVNTVRDEPDGLGSISEEQVRAGDFPIPKDERLKNKNQERLLLIAMIEDLLRFEIALREQADDGPYLVFPSQSTRENPDLPDPEGKTVVFNFEGPVLNIYATLAVRLANSGIFKKKELWKNAIIYTTTMGGTCGMFLRNIGEGRGELSLFFDKAASEETQLNFEDYVQLHLQRRALPESLKRRQIFICNGCGWIVSDQTIQLLTKRGTKMFNCPVCQECILLIDREARLSAVHLSRLLEMDRVADRQRDHETAISTVQGKQEMKDFDVFLCHNNDDKPAVKKFGKQLKDKGILPWLDEWELRPGMPWQTILQEQIKHIKSAAVFVGRSGIGPWQDVEMKAFLRQFVNRKCPVIPVILPDCEHNPELPLFLEDMTWVDFRKQDLEPMERLIWGITGVRDRSF